MANKLYNDTSVKAIADAIRAKNGTTNTYTIGEMAGAINDIPTGEVNAKFFTFSSAEPVANQNVKIVSADPDVAAHYTDPNAMITVRKMTNNSTNGLVFLMNSNHQFGNNYGVYMNLNITAEVSANAAAPIKTNLSTETDAISIFCNSSGDIFVHCIRLQNNFGGADYLITFTW